MENKNNAIIIGDDILSETPASEDLPALTEMVYFPTMIYNMMKADFLETVSVVADEYISKAQQIREINEIYPVCMSDNFVGDERIKDFVKFISQVSWDILQRQGYAMNRYNTITHELWCQDHYKYSGMEQHIHGGGCQLSGFYFLKCHDDGPRVLIHDPRPAKLYADLPEDNSINVTAASQLINFLPKPGQLLFTNSWVPHSFSKNTLDESFRFIHFNVSLMFNPEYIEQCSISEPTVI